MVRSAEMRLSKVRLTDDDLGVEEAGSKCPIIFLGGGCERADKEREKIKVTG